jgi:hypothetical protein
MSRIGHEPIVITENAELYTVREAMRELNRLLAKLDAGELEKVVLTRGGKMVGVVLTVDAYVELRRPRDKLEPIQMRRASRARPR